MSTPLPTVAGNWSVGELVTDGRTQATRMYRVACMKCGRSDEKSERTIRNIAASAKSMGTARQTGCTTCRENRDVTPVGTKFGRWEVTGAGVTKTYSGGNVILFVPVRCGCGRAGLVRAATLKAGRSTQCKACQLKAVAAAKRKAMSA